MLSTTYEIIDIKKELNTYEYYDFENDADFITRLEYSIEKAEREWMTPVMGEDSYSSLEALDKTDLTEAQTNIYFAEVYFSIAEFYMLLAVKAKFKRLAARESKIQGGVTHTTSGMIGQEMAANDYYEKAKKCLSEGGYNANATLVRRSSIYGA